MCQELAQRRGVKLKSFVFPANLGGNLASLKRCGFIGYRWRSHFELDVLRRDEFGLWRIPGGISWETPMGWSAGAWLTALKRCVDAAISSGTVLHLWFHPSCERADVEIVLPALLEYIAARSNGINVTTMAGLTN
jgi:hypothetical protein